eukprot:CAMPEP_0201550422 /NCGR_PEP_ID=MMETSP0173_2-20130828/6775_1 /ASSEMBLY_ACC=CAM_ASM_000268 /TAXON_ID=218659 /ORGANISM="Vexillifera sp., Strain DIVA3 564/2" /LENGTH=549 /DNA_ID=CAMNT_0047960383 /DNA_START=35 /DNA_END=1684 /DNA_ORIENTATION=+
MNTNTGFSSLLKDGSKHLSGVEESTIRNIQACKAIAHTTRTSLGPNGMNKMVIDKRESVFVTSDAATIIKELEVIHPAAKMIVMAAERQEQECGDGTNTVITLCGELLQQAEGLIQVGLHTSEIIAGYRKAGAKCLAFLEELATFKVSDLRNIEEVGKYMKSCIDAKQYGYADKLTPIIGQACLDILPAQAASSTTTSSTSPIEFNVDGVRVVKILGGGVLDSKLVRGLAITMDAEGTIKHVNNAKIGVFVAGIDVPRTEAKGTLRFDNAKDLEEFSRGEEKELETIVQEIADSGANVVVSGQSVGDMAMHFLERHNIMVLKIPSKFQLRRLCKATGARPLVRMGSPTPEELGSANYVGIDEIGSTKVCSIRVDQDSPISTIIVRASSQNFLSDVERCVDDGVNTFKAITRDPRFVAGAGATEIELAQRLQKFGESVPGLDQYAIKKFAESLEVVPRILAENAGMKSTDTISSLYAAHQSGKSTYGINIENGELACAASELSVFDSYLVKAWAIKLATDVATTVLNVDQIVMNKMAGGPKIPQMGNRDA